MANSKEFALPGGLTAFGGVPVNPDTGNPRLSRTMADIMMGMVPGASGVAVNAFRANMPNGIKSSIDAMTRSIVTSAAGLPMTIRSTDPADVGENVLIRPLGANFAQMAMQTVTLNGTTPVSIAGGTPLTRINLVARSSGDFTGDILVESGGVVYAFIEAGQQSMRSSLFTVPAGYRFFLLDMNSSLAKDTGASVSAAMSLEIKPALSTGFGSLVAWTLIRDAAIPAHIAQQCPQGLTGPLDFRAFGTASASSMDLQTLMSGILQDLSVTL